MNHIFDIIANGLYIMLIQACSSVLTVTDCTDLNFIQISHVPPQHCEDEVSCVVNLR